MVKKDNYIRKKDLETEIMAFIDGADEPDYIVIEVLRQIISKIRSKKKEKTYAK